MQPVYRVLVLLVISLSAVGIHAQELWRGTSIGMSPQAVRALFPEATLVAQGARGKLDGGAEELVRIERFAYVDEAFKASFYFFGSKLVQVSLSPHNKSDPIRR